ncbi:MAG: L,D-transpeptidase, partial [Chloroflexota bacterium]|nr:L,D-transpeptidase [Chloroflexota bacterium]
FAELGREVRFATVRSPRALIPAAPVRLKWGEPLSITWDAPIDEVRYDVSPPTAIRGWVDPADRRRSMLAIEEPADGTTYRVTVAGARGANGIEARQPAEMLVAFPPRPRLLDGEEARTLEDGKPLTLRWSTPIDRVKLVAEPPIELAWQVDRRDPSVVEVRLDGPAQGMTYALTVAEAYSREGAPLDEQPTLEVRTPEALTVEELDTGEDGPRATIKARPTLAFSQPIRDRRAAQAAISVEPAIAGRWEWVDDHRVRFIPLRPLPYDTEITFTVKPGRDGARSQAGSYLEEPATLSLVTETDKVIDVDVTRQVMTLIQQGRTVRTLKVATGVPGADTPIGEFEVQYKMPVARFRGVNVNGSTYDIPDVKWVLAFLGDYTIHGAYWRSNFGAPGSNGCVSLTDADAKAVFDWAPEGTRIKVHY